MWTLRGEHSETDPASGALATLGLVALLLTLLTRRLLPACAGCAAAHAPLLRVQVAMAVLCGLAWRDIEAPGRTPGSLDAMEAAARALRAALSDLLAALMRHRAPRRWPAGLRRPSAAPALRGSPAPCLRTAGVRARDGPSLAAVPN